MIHYNRHLYSDKGPNVSKGENKKREEKMGRLAECMFLRLARDCGGVAANGLRRCLRADGLRRARGVVCVGGHYSEVGGFRRGLRRGLRCSRRGLRRRADCGGIGSVGSVVCRDVWKRDGVCGRRRGWGGLQY
jgi:hypothetical protein